MPLIIESKTIRIPVAVGNETVIFVCRQPTAAEISNFLSHRFVRRRNKVQDRLYEARAVFVDTILIDVENVQYRAATGEVRPLNSQTELSDADKTQQSQRIGQPVSTWKDMLQVNWKSAVAMYFEDQQTLGEDEDDEGN